MSPPSTLRTLQIGKSWFPEQSGSGLDRVFHSLVQHLPAAGVGVRGWVAGSPDVSRSSGGAVRAFASDRASLPTRVRGLRRLAPHALDEADADLVASHFALYTFPVLDVLRHTPMVVHFHGPWATESQVEGARPLVVRAKRALERIVYRRGTRFIVLSEAFRHVLRTDYGVSDDHIRVVPGGVEVDRFDTGRSREAARRAMGWPQDRPIVLTVRRLAHRMGLEAMIDAFAAVIRRVPDALLYMAGHGPIADDLQARIDSRGLGDHVRLLGFVPDADLPLAYRAADLSVVPSVALEGFGLITLESLAAGTPVLVTPVGGLPEVVGRLSGDLVLPDMRAGSLSDRIAAVLTGRLALPSSADCQAYAREHFDWPVIARQTRAVYEEALSSSTGPG